MPLKQEFRRLIRSWGYDSCGYTPISHPIARRKWILESNDIDTVIDVGANTGQFGQHLRRDVNYKKRIVSFEPLTSAYQRLKLQAEGDPLWEVFNFALGDRIEKQDINISGNSFSSSLLDMLPSHELAAPGSAYLGKEAIDVKTLDSICAGLCSSGNNVYLKIDTQGFESHVLRGARDSLAHIHLVQMEMSLVPLYQGELEFSDLHTMMRDMGYGLVALDPAFFDSASGRLLQVDGVFHRPSPTSVA